jgi:hypothetical protein
MVRFFIDYFLSEPRKIFEAIMEYFWQENLPQVQPKRIIKKLFREIKTVS